MLGAVDVYAGEPKAAPLSTATAVYPASTANRSLENPTRFNPERPLSSADTSENGPLRKSAPSLRTEDSMTRAPVETPSVNLPSSRTASAPPAPSLYENDRAGQGQKATTNQPPLAPPPNAEPKAWVFLPKPVTNKLRDQQTMDADSGSAVNFASSVPGPPAPLDAGRTDQPADQSSRAAWRGGKQ